MKLRNKKTGEVAEVYLDNYTDESNIVSVCLKVKDDVSPDGYKYIASYTNLVELLGEWEDYAPKEPLIKDEKIRKVVRAWAEINDAKELHQWSGFKLEDECNYIIEFESLCFSNLEEGEDYTIAQLCGEEE